MAKRELVRGGAASLCEHPAGGVFFVRPLATKELLRYREELKAKGIDVAGDEASGASVSVRSDVDDFQALVEFVKARVERVADIVDATTGADVPSSPELIEELLWQIWETEDPQKKMLVAAWVLARAVELGNGRKADEVKN